MKQSVLANSLRMFETEITGEKLTLRINNAVWLNLLADYNLGQKAWLEEYEVNEVLASIKFVASVLKANGHETTYEEIAEKTDQYQLITFMINYQKALFGNRGRKGWKSLCGKVEEVDWDDLYFLCRKFFGMTKQEFMYDHDLMMVVDLIHRQVRSGRKQEEIEPEMNAKAFFM